MNEDIKAKDTELNAQGGEPGFLPGADKKLQQMLAALWERSRITVAERVEVLREARALLEQNKLDEEARTRAIDAAHKLAGVLGTFGLPRGSELAREAETAFTTVGNIPAESEKLRSLLDELTTLVDKRS